MTTVVPNARERSMPVDGAIVATVLVLLVQVPPVEAEESVMLVPTQRAELPVIDEGNGLTVTVAAMPHPDGGIYVIDVVPAEMPVTTPVEDPTVAIAVFALVHVPPATGSLNVVVLPIHVLFTPVMPGGGGTTVTIPAMVHPVPANLNVIVAVPPAIPVTMPEVGLTVATSVLPLAHVPEPDELLKVVVPPIQTVMIPEMAAGAGLMVTVVTTLQPVLNNT